MFKQSVLNQSGQLWKLVVVIMALLVGSFAPLYPALGISWTSGTILACGGYIFGLIAIRCASCNRMWFWDAALDTGLYKPLFTRSACPSCKHQYDA